jgi:hypothetical protein
MAQSLTTLQSTALGPVLTASGVSPTVSATTIAYPGIVTAADPAGGETITVTGTGFAAGIAAYINATLCTTTYGNSTSLTFTTPATAVGTYNVSLYNTNGTNGTKPGGIVFSPLPVWITASGALPSVTINTSYSTSISATGDTIVYSLTSGSLPTGLSLNTNTGAITGTPTVAATSTFTITATDAQNQVAPRNFSIEVTTPATIDYLVVAAGGGGGGYGAGAGAGGLLSATGVTITSGSVFTITVGAGGVCAGVADAQITGTRGGNSSITGLGFTTVTSIGGGGGQGYGRPFAAQQNGGSGGGGAPTTTAFGAGVYPGSTYLSQARQGYDGGNYTGTGGGNERMGNGGGAGAAGASGSPTGTGGIGLQSSITGTATYYAGGGGGGGYTGNQPGGLGGGGQGGTATVAPYTGIAGTVNTGGGGGGGSYTGGGFATGGSGGSGVVILRLLSSVTVSATTGSPTITTDGSYKVYKFTASGSITF